MKASWKYLIISQLLVIIMIACSDDENNEPSIAEPNAYKGIQGEWTSRLRSTLVYFGDSNLYHYGEFNEHGRVGRIDSGQWRLEGDTLYVWGTSGGSYKRLIVKLDQDSLIYGTQLSTGAYDYLYPYRRRSAAEETCCPFK